MIISVASHLDHGLRPEHIEWMLWHYLGRQAAEAEIKRRIRNRMAVM